ncbi:capZ-interacting protein isoform X2 [Brienomyrus brachyistius]|uniref:capZ-interacting protein isoform X2 n=1 Tax=Brienomyrus brachyistius TaxID=42636 RepID=UPI0020B1B6E0|nr:capZ-interacting protein isoform X2 [Brienomyrus brachyistius]
MEKPTTPSPPPPKAKSRNSALIEKLQANLVLSPPSLSLPVRSPEGRLHPRPVSANPPSRENTPGTFERPAEGAVLPSFNKGRPRLSMKRRPPSRQHRKSYIEEQGTESGASSFQQSSEEGEVPGTPLEKSQETTEADGPASTAKAEIDGDSAGVQDEGSVCPTESTVKEEVVPDGDCERIPAEIHSASTQEPELTTSPGVLAEQIENQPRSLGD